MTAPDTCTHGNAVVVYNDMKCPLCEIQDTLDELQEQVATLTEERDTAREERDNAISERDEKQRDIEALEAQ